MLVFELGGRRFGLPVAEVLELLRAVTIVPVPVGPAMIEGAINLRGSIVPVPDLRALLGLPGRAIDPADHLVVVESGGRPAALRVDRALGLVSLGEGDVGRAVGGGSGLAGMARRPDGLVSLLDLPALLASAGLAGEGGP